MGVVALEERKLLTRRNFLKMAALAAAALPVYSGEISRHELSVENHTIQLPRLPEVFRGLRIVQVSDLHYANFTEPFFIRKVVREVNRLKPDVLVYTGDYVTIGHWPNSQIDGFAYNCAEILSQAECPIRYSVLGNHDYAVNRWVVTDALNTNNLPVLSNIAVPLEREGRRLWFGGTGDALSNDVDLDKAVPKASRVDGEPVILLSHEPDILERVARYNVDLMLAGHTHGGQVRLPFMPPMFLPQYGVKYVEGWFRMGQTQLYVNRGIGTVNLPFRLNCPPEITVFTLA
jgi:uncharacterized protein